MHSIRGTGCTAQHVAVKDAKRGNEDARHWLAHGGKCLLVALDLALFAMLAALVRRKRG